MDIKEKAAYLKGLADGLDLGDSKEAKVINGLLDLVSEMAEQIGDLQEYTEAIDGDLSDLEDSVYDEDDECFDDCDCCPDAYEIDCPKCGSTVYVCEDDLLDGEAIECPVCGEDITSVVDELFGDDEDEDEDDED
ncbi:MAG: AraC family transcriptional regulator [Clostridiales bacterium]|nr:AraC family transcriptional regulator [Clostridiales bacterium]